MKNRFLDLWREPPVDPYSAAAKWATAFDPPTEPEVVEPEVAEPEVVYCSQCGNTDPSKVLGIEYAYGEPNRYDGVSEWSCRVCEARTGRWSKKILGENESERPFGGLH
jgi:hypothetical protein